MNETVRAARRRLARDLKGQTLLVDAPNTAYALQLKKILLMSGLKEGVDYTDLPDRRHQHGCGRGMRENKAYKAADAQPAASRSTPRRRGLKSMGRAVDLIGPYQATGTFVLRRWAAGEPRDARAPPRRRSSRARAGRWRRPTRTRP